MQTLKAHIIGIGFLLSVLNVNAQTIKLSNGISLSSISTNTENSILSNYLIKYTTSIGIDYLKHQYFYLSSEVNYLNIGGKSKNAIFDMNAVKFSESWEYIGLNTTMRAKYDLPSSHIYIGAGFKLDLLTGSNKLKYHYLGENYQMKRSSFGNKFDIGYNYNWNKLSLGSNISYYLNWGKVGSSPYENLNRNTFTFTLVIGYKLGKI